MKLAPYVEKLNSSQEYKSFIKTHKDSFLIAGFFILDLEMGKNVHQVDFYLPSEKKIAAFTLDDKVTVQILESLGGKVPEVLDIKTNVDLDALQGILQDEMKNRSITEKIRKIIAILQTINGKKVWNLNCVLTGMEILKAHIEDSSGSVLKMEKLSMMDFMQKVPSSMLPKAPAEKKDIKTELDNLDKLESEIQKQKLALKKKMSSSDGSDESEDSNQNSVSDKEVQETKPKKVKAKKA